MQPVPVSVQSRTEQYRKIVKMKTFVESSVLVLQLALCVSALKLEDGAPIADTQEGALRGTILKSRIGREFYGFKGVKYGEAAVRFEVNTASKLIRIEFGFSTESHNANLVRSFRSCS